MNRNLKKALLLVGAMAGLAATATADGWVGYCIDPASTTSPYSTDYGEEYQFNSLFACTMGVSGTVNFSKYCFPTSGFTGPTAGRIGFSVGTTGSSQDNLAGTLWDDELGLTYGMQWVTSFTPTGIQDVPASGVVGNFSIANLVVGDANGLNLKKDYFGKAGIDTAYYGASDRYFIGETTNDNIRMSLRVDVIGDAARLQWTLTNQQATAATVGLWFGQWVAPAGPQGPHSADYVTVPGLKPITTDHRFVRNANANATNPTELELPPYVNFGLYQSQAYGLQVVLSPSDQIPDQTPADGLDIGKNGWILGSMTATDGAMPDLMIDDTTFGFGSDAYIEKWNPVPVGALGSGTETRTIVAYYRGTWSVSDFARPYSAVLDAPPVIGTTPGSPQTFQNAPFKLTVHVDNTRGFSTVDKAVPLQDVKVTLNLPQGMYDANNPSRQQITQFINQVAPQTIASVTFTVGVSPNLFGNQQYSVSITPNPGVAKILTGTIVVASTPVLKISNTANLVAAPWQFSNQTWKQILEQNSSLILDTNYQVFGWDSLAQQYVLQTGPQRGFGSFVISNVDVPNPIPLGGSPQQVNDLQTGAPQIILHPGWNLISDPYNYAIPVGQLVGVPLSDNQNSYTFQQLANQNIVSGFLASWDTVTQGYKYTTSFSDLLQPNTGYWLFVQSDQDVVLDFPPVFQAFLPGLPDPGGIPKHKDPKTNLTAQTTWNVQLVAQSNGKVDSQTTIGQAASATVAKTLTRFKPPIVPAQNTVWTSIPVQSGKKTVQLASALTAQGVASQTWNWQVYTGGAGPVTITWPTVATVPNNVRIRIIDSTTGIERNLKQVRGYSFVAKAKTIRNFKVVVETAPALPVISSITASPVATTMDASYVLSVNANSTVSVRQGTQTIATLVSNRQDMLGTSKVTWNYLDAANRKVRPGTYQLVVSSAPSGGALETKAVSFIVKR